MGNIRHIGRLVLQGGPDNWPDRESLLFETLSSRWPAGQHVKFLITQGGFTTAAFPLVWNGGSGWNSTINDLDLLLPCANDALSQVLTNRVLQSAQKKVDVITVGLDLGGNPPLRHAELVAVCEVASRQVHWTGKSYPVVDQEKSLVQIIDLDTHLLDMADERVLVLGCHDLNMFNARGWANQNNDGVRRQRCKRFRELASNFKPTVILHHPHRTDTPKTWRPAWLQISRDLPSVKAWASAIAYYRLGNQPRSCIEKVLTATQGGLPCENFFTNALP
jgi:hypothetical protein